jgi:hypothetical protein
MNKHIKIGTYLYAVWPYIELAEETDEEYMSQVTEYKEGITPDDAPDSAAALFREAFSLGNNLLPREYQDQMAARRKRPREARV